MEGIGGLWFWGGGGGREASLPKDGLFPLGGNGGGVLSSVGLPGTGGRGGLFEKGEGGLTGDDCRMNPPGPEFLLPGKGGGVSPKLACLLAPGTGGGPLLYRLDGIGLGVFGTGGAPVSGREPKSGLEGGIRFLCGSGTGALSPEGPGNLPTPLGGEKGFADVARPPGGNTGALFPAESKNRKQLVDPRTEVCRRENKLYLGDFV